MESVNDKLALERSLQFNKLVRNQYDIGKQEYMPWHTYKNRLLGRASLIVDLTLGAPGVFCFAPRAFQAFLTSSEEVRCRCLLPLIVKVGMQRVMIDKCW